MSTIPDAWDDDYPALADSKTAQQPPQPAAERVSRAERRARHAEANKQLWESAENPETFHYVELRNGEVPVSSEFKPVLKVLSRKPTKPNNVENGIGMSNMEDDLDSEEEERREQEKKIKARQEQAAQERAEKQRKYDEARARIMGTSSPANDISNSDRNSPTRRSGGRSRARGDRRGGKLGPNGRGSQETSSADQSPARTSTPGKQLFDPNESNRPGSGYQRRLIPASVTGDRPIRQPTGPDGSGRGGFGFAARGGTPNSS